MFYLPMLKVALVFLLMYNMRAATTNTSNRRTPPIPPLTEIIVVSSVLLCAATTGSREVGVVWGDTAVVMAIVQSGLCSCKRRTGQLSKTCNTTPWKVTLGEVRTHSHSW